MKKLLLLGGSRFIIPVIEAAHKLGLYVITCDFLPDNFAHKYSDEYQNISIIDKEAIFDMAKRLKINGIMSFACDPGVETAAYVAEKMGLPFAGSYSAVCILQNKAKFREFLEENNFNTPKSKGFDNIDDAINNSDYFSFPVIVKPVDSAGSKGCTKVEAKNELRQAATYALSFSKTKSFIVEEYIKQKGYSSDTDCFSIDGKLVFASFSSQRFDLNAENSYAPTAYSWPSNMPLNVQNELRSELQRLITLLDLKTSLYNVETRQGVDGKAYIMEFTPRGGGNRLSEMLKISSGNDLIFNAVKAAIGDESIDISLDPIYNGHYGILLLHSLKEGKFVKIEYSKEILPYIIEKDIWVKENDFIHKFTGANETIGNLILKCDSNEQINNFLDNANKYVKVVVR